MTLQGQVTRNAALKDATVCLDLNANDACDAGEPTSAPTGANGMYSVTAMPAQTTGVRLIAVVKANLTADASNPAQPVTTTTDYVLKRPAGSAGGINPLTTLVQVGVAAGMSNSQARTNVATQLGIAAGKIDDYQGDPPASDTQVQDTARWIAAFTSIALRDGIPLAVADPSVAGSASEQMDNLIWADASNFYWRSLQAAARPTGSATTTVADARAGKIAGATRPDFGAANSLYRSAYLTPGGWQMCGRNTPAITSTGGNPSRSLYCGTSSAVTLSQPSAVAGEAMAALVTRWQADPATNRINNDGTSTAALVGALGATAFPAGAEEAQRRGLTLTADILVDNTWTRGLAQARGTTLAAMVTNHPVASVNLTDGTTSAQTTISLGLGSGATKNMRVAFGPAAGAAQFYECDLDASGTVFAVPPNCAPTTAGTYSIETVNGASIMRFAGHPAVVSTSSYEVVYTEIDWGGGAGNQWVYRAHATKPDWQFRHARSMRLNTTAWSALKAQLGL
ncbi:MAG: hypothetical protein V9G22_09380 [Ottowia sp.]